MTVTIGHVLTFVAGFLVTYVGLEYWKFRRDTRGDHDDD